MIEKKTTTYSIIGSLGVHMLFTLGAGSFLMNINKNIQPPKTYKLEFVKRKVPPPIKKEKIRKNAAKSVGDILGKNINMSQFYCI